jgi:peroxiredoxin
MKITRLSCGTFCLVMALFLCGISVPKAFAAGNDQQRETAFAKQFSAFYPYTERRGMEPMNFVDGTGKTITLNDYKGQVVLLHFWATWCEPCREEMPEISALAAEHPEIAVLGLAIDEAAAVHEFAESTPVSYPLLIAENEGMPLAEQLGNTKGVLPYTVVISANGQVTHTFFGRVNRQMLQKALNLP